MFDNYILGAYYPQQVFETTCAKRNTAPVRRGFFTSVLPSMGGVSQLVRLATWLCTGFQHPAHPIRLKPSLVGLTQLAKETTMSNQASLARIERDTASLLNDFIGIHQRETLERVASGIIDLSVTLAAEGTENTTLFRMADMLSIALRYELANLQQPSGETL